MPSSSSSGPPRPASSSRPRIPLPSDPLWRHPDFLRLWCGRAVSQVGTELSLVAIPLYAALSLDASPVEMGALAASAGIPRLLLGFVAGAWVDRVRRRPIMVAADAGRAVAVAIVPVAALLDMESFWLLLAVSIVTGALSVFFGAAWAPYLPGLVGRAPSRPRTARSWRAARWHR